MKKRALITSILTIIMCLSLMTGATFALFTSTSEVNIAVTSANVDVRAVADDLEVDMYSGTATLNGNQISVERMLPGDSFNFNIDIENYSDVTVQYRTIISNVHGGLFSALKITLTENGEQSIYNGGYVYQNWAELSANDNDATTKEDVKTINVLVEFPDTGLPQNQYQNKTCTMKVLVEAVQGNAYVENPIDYDAERNAYVINNEQGMMLMNGIINSTSRGEGRPINFILNDDMDMSGYEWLSLDMHWVNLDGQGHTISNLRCVPNPTISAIRGGQVGFAAYFGGSNMANVEFENVTVSGDQAGIVAGHYEGGTLSNIVIDGENLIIWEDIAVEEWGGIGVVFGVMSQDLPASNLRTTQITILSTSKTVVDYNNLVTKLTATGNELCFNNKSIVAEVAENAVEIVGKFSDFVEGTIVLSNGTFVIYNLQNLLDFAQAVNTNSANENNFIGNATLYTDIDLTDVDWTPIGNGSNRFAGVFDGQGHTIYGLSYEETKDCVGFFGGIVNATIKDVTFDNFTLKPANGRYVSAVTAYAFGNNAFENVTVSNAYLSGVAMVGGFIGCVNELYVENTFTNCTITDSKIVVAYDGGSFIGYSNFGCDVEFDNCFATNIDFQLTGISKNGNDEIISYYDYKDGYVYRVYAGGYYASAGKLYSYAGINGGTMKNAQEGVTVENVTYVCDFILGEGLVRTHGLLWNGFDTYFVETAEALCFISECTNTYGTDIFDYQTIELIADIDLAGIDWTPIAYGSYLFCTNVEGNGYTISNLKQTTEYASNGFIGAICYSTIKNINFVNCEVVIHNGLCQGIVAGSAYGNNVFENVNVSKFHVSGWAYIGAMIGYVPYNNDYTNTFINCNVSTGKVTAGCNGGGYIGYVSTACVVTFADSVLDNVYFEVTAGDSYHFVGDKLYYGDCAAMGLLYVGEVNLAGTPINAQDGITTSRLCYYYPYLPDGENIVPIN